MPMLVLKPGKVQINCLIAILNVVFSKSLCVSFTITLGSSSKELCAGSLSVFVLRQLHVTPLGCCLKVIVNETPRDLKKTTFSALSVILINLSCYLYFEVLSSQAKIEENHFLKTEARNKCVNPLVTRQKNLSYFAEIHRNNTVHRVILKFKL